MRNRRFEQFRELLDQLPRPLRILDIGGYEGYWQQRGMAGDPAVDITVLNLELTETSASNIHGVKGDATDLAEYSDDAFDVVHSNSVIEHLGTASNQRRMAAEVQRVGRRYYVQTPAKYFPVEPHVLLPAYEYLPRSLKAKVLTRTGWSKLGRLSEDDAAALLTELRLLSRKEFQQLFPDGRLVVERFAGLAKSFTVHNFS
ncbi:MAG: class I SAM-dependent methyltransferase [Actinobacteria bacterium]|nr:class I SAM-dependent methyltransferase [Actinomycetota bacterium]